MSLKLSVKYLTFILLSLFIVACSSNKSKDKPAPDVAPTEQGADATGLGNASGIDEEPVVNTPKISFNELKTTVYFGFDKSTLTESSRMALDKIASYLKGNKVKLRLEGHTDERGSREYNMALGERRGQSVKDYLVARGISPSRLEVISYGEEKPAVRSSSLDAYAKNRRVVIALR